MSKMSDLMLEIQDLVERGFDAKFIAAALDVPLYWAENAIKEYGMENEIE